MFSDFKFALRRLGKTPGFSVIALVTLALGIGVNTSMFSVINTLLLHQPPYPDPGALIRVHRTSPAFQYGAHSVANYLDFAARAKAFSELAAYADQNYNLAEPGQRAQRLRGFNVTGNFFKLIGVPPALGRFITPEDDKSGDSTVVLSDTAWRRYFAADPAIVGREIRLDSRSVTVIGVMPRGFDDQILWGPVDAWRPLAFSESVRHNRGGNWLEIIGRLRPGVAAGTALSEMNTISATLAAAYPDTNAQTGVKFVPFVRSTQDNVARLLSLFAMGLAICVLLITCVNLANLLFARNVLRNREHAILAALGASRRHLLQQGLSESLLLALGGGALGLLVSLWCNSLLGSQLHLAGGAHLVLMLDWRVIGFAFVAAGWAAMGFGLLPSLLVSRIDVNEVLKQNSNRNTSSAHHRARHILIVAQVALVLILLSGTGFFIHGLERFLVVNHGWNTANLLTANLSLPRAKYGSNEALAAFYDHLQNRLAALPGVEKVALARSLPIEGFGWLQRLVVEGQPAPSSGAEPLRDVNAVTPGYFETMGITVLQGRTFTAADFNGPIRTVISESMAAKLWPGQSALGKRIAHPLFPGVWHEIIGVVREVKPAANLERESGRFQTYRLLAREPVSDISIALRCSVPPDALVRAVQRAINELDPDLPVNDLSPVHQVIAENLSNYATIGGMLAGFAGLGLLLAAIGIYGVVAGSVAQRTHEIGIRTALGAQVRDILGLVLGQGLRLTIIGSAAGLAGSLAVARLLSSLVPALPAAEPLTVVSVVALLFLVTAIACYLPARRATRIDAVEALRTE